MSVDALGKLPIKPCPPPEPSSGEYDWIDEEADVSKNLDSELPPIGVSPEDLTHGLDDEPTPEALPPTLGSLLDDAFLKAERRKSGEERPVELPFGEYSQILQGGWWPGVHVLVSGTGVGKSQFSFQAAVHAAQRGTPVLYIGLELSQFQVALRAVSETAGMGWSSFYTGTYSDEQLRKAREAQPLIADLPFYVEFGEAHGWTPGRMVAKCEAIRREHPEGTMLVVLDFLQLVSAEHLEGFRTPDLRERIARAAYAGVHVANTYNAAVVLVSSAARDKYSLLASDVKGAGLTTSKRPGDFGPSRIITRPETLIGIGKESGEIEFSAESQTVLIRWPHLLPTGERAILAAVPKLRYGPPSWCAFSFHRRFHEMPIGDVSELPASDDDDGEALEERILETVRQRPGLTSASKIAQMTTGRKADVLEGVKTLLRVGKLDQVRGVFVVPDGKGGTDASS